MDDAIIYTLDHAIRKLEINLMPGRFVVNTQGKGLLDRPRTIDIPLTSLEHFTVVPTIYAQHIVAGTHVENAVTDNSYDSEFIFTFRDADKRNSKRVFVNSQTFEFIVLLNELKRVRPDANLTHLVPAEALQQMGVLSASSGVKLVIGLLIGIPILAVLIGLLTS